MMAASTVSPGISSGSRSRLTKDDEEYGYGEIVWHNVWSEVYGDGKLKKGWVGGSILHSNCSLPSFGRCLMASHKVKRFLRLFLATAEVFD